MISPWTWTKAWQSAISPIALQKVAEELVHELQERDYTSRDIFGCRLGLEEGLVESIGTWVSVDESVTIEISCRGTTGRLHLYVAGQLRYEK
jgi:hypothetical protein